MAWTFYEPGEFHDADFPEPLWLAEPIIPYRGVAMLHGPKTAGKTQLAVTLAVAVLHGESFLGEFPCRQGGVVLVEADMPRKLLQERLRGCPESRGLVVLYNDPFDVAQEAVRRPYPSELEAARDTNPALVIVDSLRKTSRLDEQDSSTPSTVYGAWRTLFPTATILILHHDRKKPTNPKAALHAEEAARGTGAWLDDADAGMRLSRARGGQPGEHFAWLTFTKQRAEEIEPIHLKMAENTLLMGRTTMTARQQLRAALLQNAKMTREEARKFLLDKRLCGRTMAYRLVAELIP